MAYVKSQEKKKKVWRVVAGVVLVLALAAVAAAVLLSPGRLKHVGAELDAGADEGKTTVVSEEVGEEVPNLFGLSSLLGGDGADGTGDADATEAAGADADNAADTAGAGGTGSDAEGNAADANGGTAGAAGGSAQAGANADKNGAGSATAYNIPANVRSAFAQAGDSYAETHKYCIAVNTAKNIVTVYERASDGTFTKPVKAMVASCGKSESPTKTGTFKTSDKYTWRALNGGVYGQYATRIDGPYLFHSVPYYKQDPSTLETDEYNHLGENRSLGCVRLAVKDCKWIYDNCPSGTLVTIYSDATAGEPLARPASKHIPTSGDKSGWDPTDPNQNNPWNN